MAACGERYELTLSNDGTIYSIVYNKDDVSLPTPIPNLPKISMVYCGSNFAVCVDFEGFMWPFGDKKY